MYKITVTFILNTPSIQTAEEYISALVDDIQENEKKKPILIHYKHVVSRELLEDENYE